MLFPTKKRWSTYISTSVNSILYFIVFCQRRVISPCNFIILAESSLHYSEPILRYTTVRREPLGSCNMTIPRQVDKPANDIDKLKKHVLAKCTINYKLQFTTYLYHLGSCFPCVFSLGLFVTSCVALYGLCTCHNHCVCSFE